jgi:hypothetical protein
MAGGESTKTVSKKLLESYFQTNVPSAPAVPPVGTTDAPAAPKVTFLAANALVTNQVAEVKRVWAIIEAELAKDIPSADKLALLQNWLLHQAENFTLRAEYLALTSLKDEAGQAKNDERMKQDIAKLTSYLKNRFTAVIEAPKDTRSPLDPGDKNASDAADRKGVIDAMPDAERLNKSAEWRAGVAKDESERRARLAHLLVHLDKEAAWQKRAMVIVGMRRYVQAITTQTQRFGDMILAAERSLPEDQALFTKHEAHLREKATQYQERARIIAEIRAATTEQKTQQDDAVSRRQTQLDELTTQLNKVKTEVDDLLVKQTGIEKQLFEIQREVGLTLEEVYRLEKLLADIERERYGLQPK